MHRATVNEIRLDFAITTASPLCIQAHDSQRFVRTSHPLRGDLSVYIPGPTLKGTLRSAAEHVLHGAGVDCCTPDHPCAQREAVKRALTSTSAAPGADLYRALCIACRLFGSTVMRSHLTAIDSFPAEPVSAGTIRDHAAGAIEVVEDEIFYGTLTLRNFERWQIGLLALLISRINIADIQIGAHRSEGMGCVTFRYTRLTVLYPGFDSGSGRHETLRRRIHGAGQLLGNGNPYGYVYPDVADVADLPDQARLEQGLGYAAAILAPDDADDAEQAETFHFLIDNVLTQQALAWGNYLHKGKR